METTVTGWMEWVVGAVVLAVAVWCLSYYWLAPLCDRKGWLQWL